METFSQLKIIRLTTFLDFGGIEKRLINISIHNDENEWIFCAIGNGGNAANTIKKNNKKVICFNYSYRIPNVVTIYKLVKFFKKEKPQVVHTSGAEANFHGILAAKLARVPIIVGEEVGIPNQSSIAKKIFSFVYSLADFVVGNSLEVIKYLKTNNKVADIKLKQISNPVVFPNLTAVKDSDKNRFNIISVSRLEKVKNIDSTLRVIARLVNINIPIHYSIIGDGNEMDSLKELVKDLKIKKNVSFLGFQNSPYEFLLQSDLYLITSFSEGFSNSLMEAMYCGIPSLSTRVGAAEEVIRDGRNGWIVNVNDDDDLFDKLKSIINMTNEERIEIGKAGKKTVIENYSLSNHISSLMSIYSKI